MLTQSLERFRTAVAAEFDGREQEWVEALSATLAQAEIVFRKHRAGARAPDGGVLAEVDETSPTVARQADEVRSDHDDLFVQILALRAEAKDALKTAEFGADFSAIRQHALHLLTGLQQNGEAETTLLQESVNTDVGGEH